MEKQNMDTETLSTLSDVSLITVKLWLRGAYEPRHVNLPKIARVLNVSADYLSRTEN